MIEVGFEDRPADPEGALEYYKKAHKLGSTDATINIAIYYLNGVHVDKDLSMGKYLLKQAYKSGNSKAVECMISFSFIKNKKEMDAEMLNIDEEFVSQMAQSSTGFNNINIPNTLSKRNLVMTEAPSKEANAFNSGNWGRTSADENMAGGLRSSMRSINNSQKFYGGGGGSGSITH